MGIGANKVISRNSIIFRHPLAVMEPVRLPWSGHIISNELIEDWKPLAEGLCKICDEMFADTPARDDLCEGCK